MEEFIHNLDVHSPLYHLDWPTLYVMGLASLAGISLGGYCRLALGAFLVWGLVVGTLGALFLWLVVSVLAIKWAILVCAAVALILYNLWFIDEQSPVTSDELVSAASTRSPDLIELFESDPAAAESIAESLNLGLDVTDPCYPPGHLFAGIPRRVGRHAVHLLILGGTVIALAAALIRYQLPDPAFSTNHDTASLAAGFELECGKLFGIQEERCLLEATRDMESRINTQRANIEAEADGDIPLTQWRAAFLDTEAHWRAYRDAHCDAIPLLTERGSGTGRFIARCRLRKTAEHLVNLQDYGGGVAEFE